MRFSTIASTILTSASLIAVTLIAAAPAQAQFAKPEDAVKYRQSAMSLIGTHMGRVGAVVKGDKPYDKAAVEADTAALEFLSKLPWSAFTPGSETDKSRAKPEIWKEQDKFKASYEKMIAEAGKLSAAAKTGDLAAVKAATGGLGKTCKNCHDDFKGK
jgi:cytochrome c556